MSQITLSTEARTNWRKLLGGFASVGTELVSNENCVDFKFLVYVMLMLKHVVILNLFVTRLPTHWLVTLSTKAVTDWQKLLSVLAMLGLVGILMEIMWILRSWNLLSWCIEAYYFIRFRIISLLAFKLVPIACSIPKNKNCLVKGLFKRKKFYWIVYQSTMC